jgi:hypothetical protein
MISYAAGDYLAEQNRPPQKKVGPTRESLPFLHNSHWLSQKKQSKRQAMYSGFNRADQCYLRWTGQWTPVGDAGTSWSIRFTGGPGEMRNSIMARPQLTHEQK